MLWAKNLLFGGVVLGGVIGLGANLLPPPPPKGAALHDAGLYRDANFRKTVDGVDAAFQAQWDEGGAKVAEPASDLQIARRLSLGLMGTVPSLEEIRQFESLPADERLPWWIEHILHDARTSDYFAERLARSYVGTEDGPFLLYRRRRFTTWLADEIRHNRPYDGTVRELIAGRGLWTDNPATNFVSVTSRPEMGNQPDAVRLAGRVTRAFLGLRIDCAQCHNHPFAAWKQDDFESLSAFFGQTHVGFAGIQDGPGEYQVDDKKREVMRTVQPKFPFSPELLPTDGTRRQQLAAWVTHPKNPYFARATVNRIWAFLCGQPLQSPVDNLEPEGATGTGGSALHPAIAILADDFVANGYDLHRLIRIIASTKVYRHDSASEHEVTEAEEKAWAIFPLTRLRPEQVAGGLLQASSIRTIDADTHIAWRLLRATQQNDFVKRYGDSGEDEFDGRGGTIPQRLLLMNGELIREKIKDSPFNASTRLRIQAPTEHASVEAAYLGVLTRRPTPAERAHFERFLADPALPKSQRFEDLFWTLLNSTEFSWNH